MYTRKRRIHQCLHSGNIGNAGRDELKTAFSFPVSSSIHLILEALGHSLNLLLKKIRMERFFLEILRLTEALVSLENNPHFRIQGDIQIK